MAVRVNGILSDYCSGCSCFNTAYKMFILFLEEIKIVMRLIAPIHNTSLPLREDAGNERTLSAVSYNFV